MLTRLVAPRVRALPAMTNLVCRALSTEATRLPYAGVRVIEKANLLSGRLAGLMFADQVMPRCGRARTLREEPRGGSARCAAD